MPRARFPKFLGLLVVTACVLVPNLSAQGTNSFQISIDQKVPCGMTPTAPPIQITLVKATVMIDPVPPATRATSVTFTIKDLAQHPWSPTLNLGGTANFTFPLPAQVPCPPTNSPVVVIHAPASADDNRYELDFHLFANYTVATSCTSTQNSTAPSDRNPDMYTIDVDSSHTIIGVCLQSFDTVQRPGTAFSCTSNNTSAVPLTETVANVVGLPTQACGTQRPGVDAILVLDKSGSMASSTTGTNPQAKMRALQSAVQKFVSAWDTIRSQEAAAPIPPNNPDKIGVVLFDQDAIWWTNGSLASGLNVFGGSTGADGKILTNLNSANCPSATSCGQLVPNTSTAIGKGLLKADAQFGTTTDTNRKAILLMSDGIQNSGPQVRPCDPNDPTNPNPNPINQTAIGTYELATPNVNTACPLANELTSKYRIYAVTVGTGMAVSAAVNQGIARAGGGFYINTEDNPNLLSPFFTELLQNFLRFNSYETARLISKIAYPTESFSTSLPISTTSQNVEYLLMWPSERGALRLTITPPGGAPPIVKEDSTGFISIAQTLPMSAPFDPLGDWKVLVEVPTTLGVSHATTTNAGEVPFDLHVVTDDAGIKSELSVVPADYKVGDNIRLRAKLMRFGLPILGVGSHLGDRIEVDTIRPGKSIGDILSDSPASAVPSGPDPQSAAEAKLENTLNTVPSPLVRLPERVQLFDDGRPEHGDDVAGDGIYGALYPAALPGHYNFAFAIQTVDPGALRFSRQQLVTAYARAIPDAGSIIFQTRILRRQNSNVLSIVMSPRVKPGPDCRQNDSKCARMGPGWANYFWFTSPGVTPFKAKDNLDGTYTASLAFTGAIPPTVAVHFENVLTVIDDSVTPDHLPESLGPGNVLTPVPPPPPDHLAGKAAVFLDVGAGIPHGTFGNFFSTGFSLNAGLEYVAASHFSVEGIFGFHDFPANVGSSLKLYQFSANGKFYLTSSGLFRPFVNGGIGGYKFSPGSTYFGGNFGGGVLREFGPHWGLQASYNFHAVNTPGSVTKYSTVQGGIRYQF